VLSQRLGIWGIRATPKPSKLETSFLASKAALWYTRLTCSQTVKRAGSYSEPEVGLQELISHLASILGSLP
jgi:hypothetical protein